jgi:hypothetical protein
MKSKLPKANIDASALLAAPLKLLIAGEIVGFVVLTGTEMVPGTIDDTFVTDRVEVVVFNATMLVVEWFPKGANVVRAFVAEQAPLRFGFVIETVTVLVVVAVIVVIRLVVESVVRAEDELALD